MPRVPDRWKWIIIGRRRGFDVATRHFGVKVGERCRILSFNFGSEPWLVEIGDHVTISLNVHFVTHDGAGWLVDDERGRRFKYGRIRIGNDVFVGIGSVILPGVRIGDRCVIGAGSVVTRSVPDGYVVAGNPARVLTTYHEFYERMRSWPAEDDKYGQTFEDRINSIVEEGFRRSVHVG
jgi:acetyltransferase-like isoleucine patch superfamily enzyme